MMKEPDLLRMYLKEGTKLVCICEGPSERTILELLLEKDCLLFDSKSIIGDIYAPRSHYTNKRFSYIREGMSFKGINEPRKPLLLLFQDNSTNFNLNKKDRDSFSEIYKVVTRNDLEVLHIHALDLWDEYSNLTNIKASDFLANHLRIKKSVLKSEEYIRNFYSDHSLVDAIKAYRSCMNPRVEYKEGGVFLADLLKDDL